MVLLTLAVLAPVARAYVNPGDTAPNFAKNELTGPAWAVGPGRTLNNYLGKVVVFYLFGATCPVCLTQAPAFQTEIWQYYQNTYPGQVQVVGVDLWNKTPNENGAFKTQTGATYPILLYGDQDPGGIFTTLYGPWDNFVVVNKQGIVRYHADIAWDHGNRYHPNEIKACVDSLVSNTVGVDPITPLGPSLRAAPNPFRDATTVELSHPGPAATSARVTVHDVTGRRIATLHDGPLAVGTTYASWNGRSETGGSAAAGVYLIRAQIGPKQLVQRVAYLR
jgi:peroxiredoxin